MIKIRENVINLESHGSVDFALVEANPNIYIGQKRTRK